MLKHDQRTFRAEGTGWVPLPKSREALPPAVTFTDSDLWTAPWRNSWHFPSLGGGRAFQVEGTAYAKSNDRAQYVWRTVRDSVLFQAKYMGQRDRKWAEGRGNRWQKQWVRRPRILCFDGNLRRGGHVEGQELESISCLLTGLLIITRVLLLLLLSEEPQYININIDIIFKEPAKAKTIHLQMVPSLVKWFSTKYCSEQPRRQIIHEYTLGGRQSSIHGGLPLFLPGTLSWFSHGPFKNT